MNRFSPKRQEIKEARKHPNDIARKSVIAMFALMATVMPAVALQDAISFGEPRWIRKVEAPKLFQQCLELELEFPRFRDG